MSDPWDDSDDTKKEKWGKKLLVTVIITIILLLLAILFFLNNRDSIQKTTDITTEELDSLNELTLSTAGLKKDSIVITDSSDMKKNENLKPTVYKKQIVEISRIRCKLAGSELVEIYISINIYLKKKQIKKDILSRRDEIKVKVQQIMSTKNMSQIKVKDLRSELINEIDLYLGGKVVEDIEFTDFRPVELVE